MKFALITVFIIFSTWLFSQNNNHVPGELIVQIDSGEDIQAIVRDLQSENAISFIETQVLSEAMGVYLVKFEDKDIDLVSIMQLFGKNQKIIGFQKNHYITQRETIPLDPEFTAQWYLKNTGESGGTIDADVDATDAWDITTGGITTHNDTIVVCIIEGGGVDINHIDLKDNIWKNHAEIPGDGIDNDNNGYIDDYNGWNVLDNTDNVGFGSHGTRVAGMVGARGDNGIGIAGINWDVKMMIVKGQQTSNEASVIAAYNYPLTMRKLYNESYGEQGAFVVCTNASWGIDGGDPADSPLWCAIYDSLGAQGVLNVAATTNNNQNVDVVGDMPTNCTSDYLIGVTMTNSNDLRANSGYGTTSVDLGAPGSGVRLPVPGDVYSTTSGTSFASPCVAGAIALAYAAPCADFIHLAKHNPAEAAITMRSYILNNVDPIVSLESEVASGGRLNINNSINALLGECEVTSCIPPYNLRFESITDTEAQLVWDGFSADYEVTVQRVGVPDQVFEVIAENSFILTDLIPCTDYIIKIRSNCLADGYSYFSYPINLTSDGCCKNPPILLDVKTEASITLEWEDVLYATAYNLRYALADEESWIELEDVSNPLLIEDLEPCTQYQFQIYTICADSTRGYSESQIYRTLGCGVCTEVDYCSVEGANDNLEWIDSLSLNGFAIQTGANGGWLRSEQIITSLTQGETYTIRFRPGYAGSNFTERFSVWIDYNQNGVFDVATETIVDDFATNTVGVQSFTVPVAAPNGITKFRIGMSALSEPTTCPSAAFFGEYEDYCVYLGPQVGISENELAFQLYPNPVDDILFFESTIPVNFINIYTINGKLIRTESTLSQNQLSTQELAPGIYMIHINTNNGIFAKKFVKQ